MRYNHKWEISDNKSILVLHTKQEMIQKWYKLMKTVKYRNPVPCTLFGPVEDDDFEYGQSEDDDPISEYQAPVVNGVERMDLFSYKICFNIAVMYRTEKEIRRIKREVVDIMNLGNVSLDGISI